MAVIQLTRHNFADETAEGLVLIDFWGAWCAPCKKQSAALEALSASHPEIKLCRLNVDEQFPLSVRWRIDTVPTLMLFRDGVPVRRAVGALDSSALEAFLK